MLRAINKSDTMPLPVNFILRIYTEDFGETRGEAQLETLQFRPLPRRGTDDCGRRASASATGAAAEDLGLLQNR